MVRTSYHSNRKVTKTKKIFKKYIILKEKTVYRQSYAQRAESIINDFVLGVDMETVAGQIQGVCFFTFKNYNFLEHKFSLNRDDRSWTSQSYGWVQSTLLVILRLWRLGARKDRYCHKWLWSRMPWSRSLASSAVETEKKGTFAWVLKSSGMCLPFFPGQSRNNTARTWRPEQLPTQVSHQGNLFGFGSMFCLIFRVLEKACSAPVSHGEIRVFKSIVCSSSYSLRTWLSLQCLLYHKNLSHGYNGIIVDTSECHWLVGWKKSFYF